ncbi:ABC transporter permease subunit [Hymenobacter taeanensis]|uniref:ABC transporter permease subunit n=1 Tax=Hymenobacter taeanensis TaxID=2735321 RepID=A0A6M6BEN7_9BACT|nr:MULTISPECIES: ABC transporter permease [Hymenobacter]QJX46204.1 ABC transporter permease subunit [Hymenobacter taeanensis]UOQ80060.1 ABC transporter permease [Hymenobacter sp. 5414T-23]
MSATLPSAEFAVALPAAPSPLQQLQRTLSGDMLKLRRTAALRLSLFSGVLPVLLTFCILYFKGQYIIKGGVNPWPQFVSMAWQTAGTLLLPLFVVLLTSLIVNIETKSSAWKHLFALPVGRGAVFFSKLLVLLGLNALALLLFVAALLGAGFLLGLVKPGLGFQTHQAPLQTVLWMYGHTYVATLGLLAVQYIVSLYWRSFVVPVGVGMGAVVVTIALLRWEHVDKIPYSAPLGTTMQMKMSKLSGLEVAHTLFRHEWYSLAWFAGALLIGYVLLQLRRAD